MDRRAFRALVGTWFLVSVALPASPLRAQAPFTEEAAQRGVSYLVLQNIGFGCGVAFVDLDQDGDPDLVTTGRADGLVGVYENDGTGNFVNRIAGTHIPPLFLASGVAAADYDADGDLDLYFSNYGEANKLMRNEGNFAFADVTDQAGVGDDGRGCGSAWTDYDGDGWVDLYVTNRTEVDPPGTPNRMYRNKGDGTFEELGMALGIDAGATLSFQASFFDFDKNGYTDLYLCTDKGGTCPIQSNHLYRNDGGTFTEITGSSGTDACIGCMGTTIGDADGNGWMDIFCTNTADGHILLTNQGDGTFNESAAAAGVISFAFAWSPAFFDFNNDGYLDLFISNDPQPNRLYQFGPLWPAQDMATTYGLDTPGASYCSAVADLDGDGDQDLVVQNWGENIKLFVNHEGETRSWLKIDLDGLSPNLNAIGARVEVTTGTQTRVRELLAGSGLKSSSSAVLHFGLGSATTADRVDVYWPGGNAVTTLTGVGVDQTLNIQQDVPRLSTTDGLKAAGPLLPR